MFSFVWRSHLNLFSQLIMLFIKSKKPKILTMQNQHHYIPLVQTCLNVSFFSCRVPLEVLEHQESLEILALLWVSINLRFSSSVTGCVTTCIAILSTIQVVVKLKPKKNSDLNQIRTHDLSDTGTVLCPITCDQASFFFTTGRYLAAAKKKGRLIAGYQSSCELVILNNSIARMSFELTSFYRKKRLVA